MLSNNTKMKKFLLFLLVPTIFFAQNANRKYEGNKLTDGVLTIKTSDGDYLIRIISESIIETSFVPKGQSFNPDSHAVILKPTKDNLYLNETSKKIEYSHVTPSISVTILKSPFSISYFYKKTPIISEKRGYIKKDSTEVLEFNLESKENLYGGGARVLGMNRRGNRLQLYNRAHYGYENKAELMNFCIPLVLSSNKYAINFDNPAIGYLDLDSKKDNTLVYETISGRKTYQIIAGDSWENVVSNYTTLTGRQPMPARWTLGNFASRFGYHSQAETERTIKKFREEKIPVDAIILDLYWFGKDIKGTMGNLAVFKDSFPDFEKMIGNLNSDGVKTIPITEPFILTTSKKWQEAVDKKILATDANGNPYKFDFYFGNTGLIDIFKKEGKEWFWDIYANLARKGAGGIWGDLGEPEVHPSGLQHTTGTADELHNIYGHNWAKLIYEGYQKEFPSQRPFILMRSGAAGSQRYGMIPWSGDVSRSWGGLAGQTEIALQMGMQGLAYMHSDLGGFAGANLDDELYTRWLQYGVFQPIFRPHAQEEVPSEPIYREPKTKALAKKSIELRYQLLPYNYTLAFENNQKGTPLMRPLFFEEPNNEMLMAKSDEYLWGNDFLLAPVIEKGQKEKLVYFPKNNNWFDFYSDKKYAGGQTEKIALTLESIPTFVRAGSFIPMSKIVQTTQNYNQNELDIHFYYDTISSKNTCKLYFDDGKTPNAFEKSQYEIIQFSAASTLTNLSLAIQNELGKNYVNTTKNFHFVIHNMIKKAKSVLLNGEKIKFTYDKTTKKLQFDLQYFDKKSEIQIKLK